MLRGPALETVIGRLRFNANDDVDVPYYTIYRWSAGEGGKSHFEELEGAP